MLHLAQEEVLQEIVGVHGGQGARVEARHGGEGGVEGVGVGRGRGQAEVGGAAVGGRWGVVGAVDGGRGLGQFADGGGQGGIEGRGELGFALGEVDRGLGL